MTRARAYESPLRAEQRDRTRMRILEAAIDVIADQGPEELTIPFVAKRAGVSVRTVYFHFPTKEALLTAAGEEFDARTGLLEFPDRAEDLPAIAPTLWQRFDENEQLIRAALVSRAGNEMRAEARRRRVVSLERALAPVVSGLGETDRRLVVALVYSMHAAPMWQMLRDYFGLTGAEASRGVSWLVGLILSELERSPGGLETGPGAAENASSPRREDARR